MMKRAVSLLLAALLLAGCLSACGTDTPAAPLPDASPSAPPEAAAPSSEPEAAPEPESPAEPKALDAAEPAPLSGDTLYFDHDNLRDDVPYAEMDRTPYDYDALFQPLLNRLNAMAETGGSSADFVEADLQLYWALYDLHTRMTLSDLAYAHAPGEDAAALVLEHDALWYRAVGEYWDCMHRLAVSPYAALLKEAYLDWQIAAFAAAGGEGAEPPDASEGPALPAAPETSDGAAEGDDPALLESELVQQYNALMTAATPDYDAIAAIFVQLVALRNETAQAYGYDSYAAYAYDVFYSRNYTPEEVQPVWAAIKEYLAPLLATYSPIVSAETQDLWDSDAIDCAPEAILDAMGRVLPRMSPEMAEAFDYMVTYGLYDIDPLPGKLSLGYTVPLYYYNEPFIFNAAQGSYYDYTDMFHEFGHYLNAYYIPSDLLFGMADNDLCELQSQGMEVLFTHWYDEIFGPEAGPKIRADTLLNLAYAAVSGAMQDEFQQRVYAEPDLTPERVTAIYLELCGDYCQLPYEGYEYEWAEVNHTFAYPFYSISYCVSAMPALELCALQEEDPVAAMASYLTIAATDPELYYYDEVLAMAQLSDPFDPATAAEVARVLTQILRVS